LLQQVKYGGRLALQTGRADAGKRGREFHLARPGGSADRIVALRSPPLASAGGFNQAREIAARVASTIALPLSRLSVESPAGSHRRRSHGRALEQRSWRIPVDKDVRGADRLVDDV
jgi:hypothetical protein